MALIYADRVKDTFTTTGTGAVTVSGTAPASFRTFSAVCSTSDTFYYCIEDTTNGAWETGLGTYSGTNQITRTTVRASSSSNNAVNFSAGTKTIFITPIAYMFPSGLTQLVGSGAVTSSGLTMATSRLLGRTTASTGAIEEITVGTGLSLSGGSLTNTATPGLVLLATLTASNSASLSNTSVFTSAYADYFIVFENLIPAADDRRLFMEWSQNAGSSWLVGSYAQRDVVTLPDSEVIDVYSRAGYDNFALPQVGGASSTTAEGGLCGSMILFNPSGTSSYKRFRADLSYVFATATYPLCDARVTGYYTGDSNAINGVRWRFDSTNVATGKIYIYGLKSS